MALTQAAGNSGNNAFKVRALELHRSIANLGYRTRKSPKLLGQRISLLRELSLMPFVHHWVLEECMYLKLYFLGEQHFE